MTRKLVPLLATAALAATVLPAASARPAGPATTQPTIVINVSIVLTDRAVTFGRSQARRGWGVHFLIANKSTKPMRIDIGGLVSPIIKPGKRGKVSAVLELRGRYPYKVTLNPPGIRAKGWFLVV